MKQSIVVKVDIEPCLAMTSVEKVAKMIDKTAAEDVQGSISSEGGSAQALGAAPTVAHPAKTAADICVGDVRAGNCSLDVAHCSSSTQTDGKKKKAKEKKMKQARKSEDDDEKEDDEKEGEDEGQALPTAEQAAKMIDKTGTQDDILKMIAEFTAEIRAGHWRSAGGGLVHRFPVAEAHRSGSGF